MKVLYIGGTGEISLACVQRSVAEGHEVTVLNRGHTKAGLPATVETVPGDVGEETAYAALGSSTFDVVCQFLGFDTPSVERDIEFFSGRCGQYLFVSSASAYAKPPAGVALVETTPLANPYWAYSRKKAACEVLLQRASSTFPVTIVRPSHTYRTRFPSTVINGDHLAWRLLRDKPILVHDDGDSLWTLTHADDFAIAFNRLFGGPVGGEAFHITSEKPHSWMSILSQVAQTLGTTPRIHSVASSILVGYEPEWRGPLLGDKSNSLRFDNTKLRSAIGEWQCEISLAEGLASVLQFTLERLEDGYAPDEKLDALIDRIVLEQDTRTD